MPGWGAASRVKYRRKAYTYVRNGKTVHVPARPGPAPPARSRKGATGKARKMGSTPAPKAPARRNARYKVDSPLRARVPTAARIVGKVSVKQGVRRTTQKGSTKNFVKRTGRRYARKAIPGTTLIRVSRRSRRRRKR